MPELVGDHLVARLREWGVRRLYGYSGDGINGILGALDRAIGKAECARRRTRIEEGREVDAQDSAIARSKRVPGGKRQEDAQKSGAAEQARA